MSDEVKPFIESESEASLRRIAEANREVIQKNFACDNAKEAYKTAKAELAEAIAFRNDVVYHETTELPLFPRVNPDASPAAPRVDPTPSPSLMTIDGFPRPAIIPLGAAGIITLADLRGFVAAGKSLYPVLAFTADLVIAVQGFLRGLDDKAA